MVLQTGVCTLRAGVNRQQWCEVSWHGSLALLGQEQPALLQLVLFTGVVLLAMLVLLLQHVWLLARGLTSYEVGKLAGTQCDAYDNTQTSTQDGNCSRYTGQPPHASPYGRSMLRTLREVALPGRP